MTLLTFISHHNHQGVDVMAQRVVRDTLPLSEVPSVMRALGFYPSEQVLHMCIWLWY